MVTGAAWYRHGWSLAPVGPPLLANRLPRTVPRKLALDEIVRRLGSATIITALMAVSAQAQTPSPAPAPTEAPSQAPVPDKSTKPSFFLFSDTQLSYWHQFTSSDPSLSYPAAKEVVTVTHVDAWKYGSNYINIDFLKSDNKDPAAPWGGPAYPIPNGGAGDGAFEIYGLYRGTLSFNELSNSVAFNVGPVKDVALYFGGDLNTKNTTFAPMTRKVVIGLQAALDVPGYLNVSANFAKEWNHNGIVPLLGFPPGMSEYVNFNGTALFEIQYMQPLAFTGVPMKFSGFTNVTLPKGADGFGNQTITELLTDNRLTLDLGKLVSNKTNTFDLFVGYRFWLNKFGTNPNPAGSAYVTGTTDSTLYLGISWHMF